jgi:hypothetical protein
MKSAVPVVLAFSALTAFGGPSSPVGFQAAITRQDFTGQGTYHRIGLLREQDRALAAARTVTPPAPVEPRAPSIFQRLWNSLFPPRSPQTTTKRP